MKKTYYAIPKLNIAVLFSALLMLSAAILRVVYFAGLHPSPGEFWLQGALPIAAGLLFAAMLLTDAGDRPYRTAVPVVLGCVFFAVKAAGFSPMHRLFCWGLYLAAAGLYYATVGHGLNKWVFGGLIGCALAYHAVVEDAMERRFMTLYTTPLAPGVPGW